MKCFLVALCVVAIGCKSTSTTGVDQSGIAVDVRRGPITPTTTEGVDNTAPVTSAIVVVSIGDRIFGQGTTDATGETRIQVPAGDYQVAVTSCPGAVTRPAPESVHVVTSTYASVTEICDTGIR